MLACNSSSPVPDSDLPADFLSTPFGQAMRPTIDAMFRRPVPGAAPTPVSFRPTPEAAAAAAAASPNPALASQLLQAVASQAFSPTGTSAAAAGVNGAPPARPLGAAETLSAPIHMCTNPSAFQGILGAHRAVVAFFTSQTCAPCRVVEPVFEELAREKAGGKTAFVKVDIEAGLGFQVGGLYSVRATPTFLFFLDGQKVRGMFGCESLSGAEDGFVGCRGAGRECAGTTLADRFADLPGIPS